MMLREEGVELILVSELLDGIKKKRFVVSEH